MDGECFTAGAVVACGQRLLIGCSDGDASGASLLRACGVELSARGVVSSVVAAGASRPGSGHFYARAGSSFAGDSLAEFGAHVDVSSGVPPVADR